MSAPSPTCWASPSTCLAERIEELLADDDNEPEPPAPPTLPAEVEDAYHILWLVPGCPRPVLDAVHRTLAKMYHPDTGAGDAATMKRVNNAYDIVLGWQERQQRRQQSAASTRSRRAARGKGAAA